MTVLCLGALLAGLVAATSIPFLPFACALLAATLLGSIWAGLGGASVGSTVLAAVVLLFACQIGFGLGLMLAAFVGHASAARRGIADKPATTPARPLRTGNGPG